jgi:hypothetical protein
VILHNRQPKQQQLYQCKVFLKINPPSRGSEASSSSYLAAASDTTGQVLVLQEQEGSRQQQGRHGELQELQEEPLLLV